MYYVLQNFTSLRPNPFQPLHSPTLQKKLKSLDRNPDPFTVLLSPLFPSQGQSLHPSCFSEILSRPPSYFFHRPLIFSLLSRPFLCSYSPTKNKNNFSPPIFLCSCCANPLFPFKAKPSCKGITTSLVSSLPKLLHCCFCFNHSVETFLLMLTFMLLKPMDSFCLHLT